MTLGARIERAIEVALVYPTAPPAPPRLAEAIRYAVLPGGARIRPSLLLAVATACGDADPELADAAAVALELVHCASLVHDDLPCFDNADFRRGKTSVHRAFSQPLAVLTGDSLIVLAFDVLARAGTRHPARTLQLIQYLTLATGVPGGICAGQGWESEASPDLRRYHQGKTGALFVAATRMGALAGGQDADPWEQLGSRIGEAFQVADDLADTQAKPETLGKPAGQDQRLGRPNAVAALGIEATKRHLGETLSAAVALIPPCPGRDALAGMVRRHADEVLAGR